MSRKNNQKEINRDDDIKNNEASSISQIPIKNSLFGVGVTNETRDSILEYLIDFIENSSENCYVVTPNPEMIVFSQKNPDFKNILNQAQIALCDGVGLWLAGKILGKPFQQRITGVDFMEKLCEKVAEKPITIGFLGGREGVAELTAKCLKAKYPGLKVVFTGSEWNEKSKVKNQNLENETTDDQRQIDILFVAFGFPKQEQWMFEHLDEIHGIHKIPVRVMMGVGGSFDYMSGKIPRAPEFIRVIGLEWLYRLIRQPWRWKRQFALIQFVWLVIKEKSGI